MDISQYSHWCLFCNGDASFVCCSFAVFFEAIAKFDTTG